MRILFMFIFVSFAASAQVRPYQTTRLKSAGGAGVASVLVTESAILNPAGLAFFGDSFASYQKSTTTLNSKNSERGADNRRFSKTNYSEGYFAFDNSGPIKGGFGYTQQRENGFGRERISGAMASRLTDTLALGAIFQHTTDNRPSWSSRHRHKTAIPVQVGVTWLPLDKLSLGAIFEDAGKAMENESRAVAGVQYSVTQDLILIADAGGDARGDFTDRHLWRVAAQYRLFNDFYVRAGKYTDKTLNEEGLGYGASWTGPKLGVDFAIKQGEQLDSEKGYLYPNEKLTDISFAVNLLF